MFLRRKPRPAPHPLADRMDAYAKVLCGIRYYTPEGEDTFSDGDLRLTLRRGAAAIRKHAPGGDGPNEARDLLIRTALSLADAAPWRQSPDWDVLKTVAAKYRAATPTPESEGA